MEQFSPDFPTRVGNSATWKGKSKYPPRKPKRRVLAGNYPNFGGRDLYTSPKVGIALQTKGYERV